MCVFNICVSVCPSVLSSTTMENITSNFSMECGTYEQLGYWPNNFDDFAVSNITSQDFVVFCLLYSVCVSLFSHLARPLLSFTVISGIEIHTVCLMEICLLCFIPHTPTF